MSRRSMEVFPDTEYIFNNEDIDTPPSAWPSVRIARRVSLENKENNSQLGRYLDIIGRLNDGKGYSRSLGSVAMTIVSAREMGLMLQKKYPKQFDNRKKTIQLMRSFSKDYNDYVKRQSQNVDDLDYEDLMVSSLLDDDDRLADVDFRAWGVASIALGKVMPFAKQKLGIEVRDELVEQEIAATINYCKAEGLDVNFIDRNRAPHLTLFNSFGPVVNARLEGPVQKPAFVTLEQPKAITAVVQ